MWLGGGGCCVNKFLKLSTKTRRWELFIYKLETGVFMTKTPGFCTKKSRLFCPSLLTTRTREWSPSWRDNAPPPNKNPYTLLIIYTCNPKSYKMSMCNIDKTSMSSISHAHRCKAMNDLMLRVNNVKEKWLLAIKTT